jgi:hypothetical protein
MVSSFSVHGTCQTAAPGSDTVGKPASPARSPNSASSHLMKRGSDNPISRMTAVGIRHIHQPL